MKKRLLLQSVSFLLLLFINICCSQSYAQVPRSGNGYENLSRRSTGGKIRTGDTLDIKMSINIPWGYNGGSSGKIYSVRYLDNIPAKTEMLSGASDSIRILTNEDNTFLRYTPVGTDDAGTYIANPPITEYQIRINLGTASTAPTSNKLTNITGASTINLSSTYPFGDKPKWWSGHLFSTSFRVRVTGNAGDTILLTGGKFVFRKVFGGTDSIISGVAYKIIIGIDDSLCQGNLGTNYAGEFGGSFGQGTTLNRTTGSSILVPGYSYVSNVSGAGNVPVNDGSYAIVNNISPWSSTNRNARRIPNCATAPIPAADSCKYRMHGGHWEIEGDHTGSTTNYGNNPPAAGVMAGYMLMVNADFITTEAYKQTINDLCPNTFYQFSAYVRNICRTCGVNTDLVSVYNQGVKPSLTFSVDNIDMYSTGKIDSTGWVKKAFLFKTGPLQTSITFAIRNNSQGGGGNDWALDDINISTCGPSLKMNYSPLLGCNNGTLVNLSDTVRYKYNSTYSWYKWQISNDNGANWTDPPVPATGEIIPQLVNGTYDFVTNYPAFMAYTADSGHLYRVVVATSEDNLGSSPCSFNDGSSVLLNLIPCNAILDANLINFNAVLTATKLPVINWQVTQEINIARYEIEKNLDGSNFVKMGEKNAEKLQRSNAYTFYSGEKISSNAWFRLKIIADNGSHQYSKIVFINSTNRFQVTNVLNPFQSVIAATVDLPEAGFLNMSLYNSFGKLNLTETRKLQKGTTKLLYNNLGNLASGIYILLFESNGTGIQKKLFKIN
jgi:hypothetical protein